MRESGFIICCCTLVVACRHEADEVVPRIPYAGTYVGLYAEDEWTPSASWDTSFPYSVIVSPFGTGSNQVTLTSSEFVGDYELDNTGYYYYNFGGMGGGGWRSCRFLLNSDPDSLILVYHGFSSLPWNQYSRDKTFRGRRIN
ncbi:MAG: hypothetical protein IPF41_12590 [Flavobacteriales bacterium]|nr:hypothetical protein [Flavobacteriales bacterium]